jgi:hypothetical protein
VRASGVVVDAPRVDLRARVGEIQQPTGGEAFVGKPPVEALDEGVLDGFPGTNEQELDVLPMRPRVKRAARELRAVIAHDGVRAAPLAHQSVQHLDHPCARKVTVHLDHGALPRVVVHQGEGAERPAVGQRIAHEVHRPALVRA